MITPKPSSRPASYLDRALAAAGVSGVLIPDLPGSATATWGAAARAASLHTVILVAPHASSSELARISARTTGLEYAPATLGVTGAQRPLSADLPRVIYRLRTATSLSVGVGIGVSTPAQAARLSAHADAVVIGSALIRHMQATPHAPAVAAVTVARNFADAIRHPSDRLREPALVQPSEATAW